MASFTGALKAMFPFISAASSLGGPIGVLAAKAVGSALGIDKVDPTPEGISTALAVATAKDPDAIVKLKQAEQDFQVQMTKLGFDNVEKLEQIAADDRANARARQIALKDWVPGTLAIAVTGGFFALLSILIWHTVPEQSHDILIAMVGTLGTAWVGIITYYFGSSKGSSDKTVILSGLAQKGGSQ